MMAEGIADRTAPKAEAFCFSRAVTIKSRCRISTSRQNCWTTSPISYTMQETRSRAVASFPNRGSRVPESTFSQIFCTPSSLRSWKSTFPHPSTSPARYTKTLHIRCPHVVTAADAGEGGWILTFARVVHFEVDPEGIPEEYHTVTSSLVLFHGFSPATKSLLLTFPVLSLPRARLTSSFYSLFSKTSR